MKIGHKFDSAVTDMYLRALPPVDVGAAVFGGESRQGDAFDFHPDTALPTVPAPDIDAVPEPLGMSVWSMLC